MWEPLPVETPQREAPGYVVFTEQSDGPFALSTERHFVPGVGMAKEVIVQALGGRLISRQELVLTAGPPGR